MIIMIKKSIVLLGILGALCGCHSQREEPLLDAIHNEALNINEVNADGVSWKLTTPPNYVVVRHNLSMIEEEMMVRSRFFVGDKSIIVVISSQKLDKQVKNMKSLYDASYESLAEMIEWETLYGPIETKFGTKEGSVVVGSSGDLLVTQFTMLVDNQVYVLRCTGDLYMKLKVTNRCKNLLDRFQVVQVP